MNMLKVKNLVLAILLMMCFSWTLCDGAVLTQQPPDTDGIDTDGDGIADNDNIFMHMTAGDGFVNMADGRLQYMFGFSDANGIADANVLNEKMLEGEFPGPTIVVREGQKLYLTLTNTGMMVRPDLFDPHTIHWHGFPQAASIFDGVPDASISINMMSSLTYFYNVLEPGTYMWHCHVEATEHMQMGMLCQLYVEPKQNLWHIDNPGDPLPGPGSFPHEAGFKYAYNDGDGSTFYDVDKPIQLASFDPDFHDASLTVQPLPFALMDDKYPMINGRGYPLTVDPNVFTSTANDIGFKAHESQKINALIEAVVGDKILLRLSSLSTTSYHTVRALGIPMQIVGTGSRILRGPEPSPGVAGIDLYHEVSSITLGGGEAYDIILNTTNVTAGTYFLYSTNLDHLSNNTEDYGGMMTEIRLTDPPI